MPVSLGNNCVSLTWEQLCQSHLKTIVSVSLGNNCVSLTWEQLRQSHLKTIVPVSHGNNCASLTWGQLCQSHLGTIGRFAPKLYRVPSVTAIFQSALISKILVFSDPLGSVERENHSCPQKCLVLHEKILNLHVCIQKLRKTDEKAKYILYLCLHLLLKYNFVFSYILSLKAVLKL